VIAASYLRRNPDLPLATAIEDIADYGRPAKVFPIAPQQRFEMLTNAGEFTSACSLTLYKGSLFVAEPAHNLVHRATLAPSGATFVARRPMPGKEFLASADPWFRPVNFSIGPDGALYLLDYYRLVIEHPEWMSEAMSQPKDLNAGNDRGRIYRITSGEAVPYWRGPGLSAMTSGQMAALLENPNPWWRRTAQRLLVDRKAVDARPALVRLAESSAQPVARVHALWTLHGLGLLDSALIERALRDPTAGVRENAVQLAEERLTQESGLADNLLKLKADPDARVRFSILCALGWVDSPTARAARDELLDQGIEDRWMQVAALSASPSEAGRLFSKSVVWVRTESKGRTSLFRMIGSVIGARRNATEVEAVLTKLAQPGPVWWRAAALEGMASGMKQPVASARAQRLLVSLFQSSETALRRPALQLLETAGLPRGSETLIAQATVIARDARAAEALRVDSIGLLGIADAKTSRRLLEELAGLQQSEAIQAAAVRAMGRIPGEETGAFLLKNWRRLPPAVRGEAADAIYRDPERLPMVLRALEDGSIQGWTLGFRHKRQLQMHRDAALRARARKVIEAGAEGRRAVIAKYRTALTGHADAGRGKRVFENVCAKCHKLNGKGEEVGPDLATVRHQPKQVLLEDILDPNKAISQGFEAWVAETTSGTIDGVLAGRTETTITLRREEGKQDVIARKEIRNLYATNLSAMPGDLEKQIDPDQMADVIEYIKAVQ
jgi:putative heme-binding domain-containing protein